MAETVVTFDFDDRHGEAGDAYDATLSLRKGASLRDGALRLDGRNDYAVVAGDAALAIDNGEIAFTFNADKVHGERTIMSRDSGGFDGGGHLTIWIDDGKLKVRLQSDSESFVVETDARAIQAHRDYDVAFRFGERGMELEVDGVVVDTNAYTGGLAGNNEPLTLGASQMVSGDGKANHLRDYFDGEIKGFKMTSHDRQDGAGSAETDVLLHEDFEGIHELEDSPNVAGHTDWNRVDDPYGHKYNDVAMSNGHNDGDLTFKAVQLDGHHAGMLQFDIRANCVENFESSGHYKDSIKVQIKVDGGHWITIDTLKRDGHSDEFVGDQSGNRFGDDGYTTLTYLNDNLPGGSETVQFRLVTHITAGNEKLFVDNVKISADKKVCDDCADDATKIDFNDLAAGAIVSDQYDHVTISATAFGGGRTIHLEAEHMHRDGFHVAHGSQASGGDLVFASSSASANHPATLSSHFDGRSGTYDVTLFIQDESDGQSTLTVTIGGETRIIELDRDTDGHGSNNSGFTPFVLEDLAIRHGDRIEISGFRDGGERVRIDKLKFEETTSSDNRAMIFDTDNITGGDGDLRAGDGKVLIISEDGDSSDPDDNARGGEITFDFDPGVTVDVTSIVVVDTEEGGTVEAFDEAGQSLGVVDIPRIADNTTATVDLGFEGVAKIVVTLNGSGAIDDLCYEKADAPLLGSLSGKYFADLNRDGQDNDGANGIGGILVELLDENGVPTGATATTAADGTYSFGDLVPGTYGVKFTDVDTGRELTQQNVGDDATDSDAGDVGNGMSTITGIAVVGGQDTPDNDAGVVTLLASLGDKVFFDDNFNGQQDAGEAGVAGVTVTLTGGGVDGVIGTADDSTATTTTDADGLYSFDGLNPGEKYKVTFEAGTLPEGFAFTDANVGDDASDSDADVVTGMTEIVTLAPGENNPTLDAGIVALASLGDRVFHDLDADGVQDLGEPGIPDAVVKLLDGDGAPVLDGNGDPVETVTDADGLYSFDGLRPGAYKVMFVQPAGFSQISAANAGGDDAADSDGDPANGLMTDVVTLAPGEDNTTLDQGFFNLAGLGDTVFRDLDKDGVQDAGEPGVGGVTVKLLADIDGDGAVDDELDSTTTDDDGFYEFRGLTPGDYAVMFVAPDGLDFTIADAGGDDALDSDSDANGMTPVVTLFSGAFDPTIDAGLVNDAPLAGDAEAMLCVGLEGPVNGQGAVRAPTIVNLLDSVSDPDGDALTIQNIFVDANGDGDFDDAGEFASVGETITTAEGLAATLNTDGTVSLDGTNAAPTLAIGDTLPDSFQYTVSDGVDAATGVVDVTLKGDLNTLETIADALPETGSFVLGFNPAGGAPFEDLYTIRLTDGLEATPEAGDNLNVDGTLDLDGVFVRAFCANADIPTGIDRDIPVTIHLMDASAPGIETAVENTDGIGIFNWILNQEYLSLTGGQEFTEAEEQWAMWLAVNDTPFDGTTAAAFFAAFEGDVSDAEALLALAQSTTDQSAPGYEAELDASLFQAGEDDIVGVLLKPTDAAPSGFEQPFVIGVEFDALSIDCECL